MLSIVIVDFIYILSESVLAFFFLEIWKISMQQKKHTLVTLYWYIYGGIYAPYPNTGVGYCLFVTKVLQNLQENKLIGLTLSYFIITRHIGVKWQK